MREGIVIVLAYLAGSVLFGPLYARLFLHQDIFEKSPDGNPGAANAFTYGGMGCGLFTLIGDILKGFLPVFFLRRGEILFVTSLWGMGLLLAAPVIGHIYPVFYHFKGGKGIATTFGVLLGLLPAVEPLAVLAIVFILFSTILRIEPHFSRTWVTYVASLVLMVVLLHQPALSFGFLVITGAVCIRLATSKEPREKMQMHMVTLWRR